MGTLVRQRSLLLCQNSLCANPSTDEHSYRDCDSDGYSHSNSNSDSNGYLHTESYRDSYIHSDYTDR